MLCAKTSHRRKSTHSTRDALLKGRPIRFSGYRHVIYRFIKKYKLQWFLIITSHKKTKTADVVETEVKTDTDVVPRMIAA